jgi:hypothetical protein
MKTGRLAAEAMMKNLTKFKPIQQNYFQGIETRNKG